MYEAKRCNHKNREGEEDYEMERKRKIVFLSGKENVRQTIRKKNRKISNQVKEKVFTNSEVTGIFIHIAIKLSGKK